MIHPSTYVNKILVGSSNGRLILLNIFTASVIYEFQRLPAGIICLAQAPALDVAAIGLSNGAILVKNLKFDATIKTFHTSSLVSSLSFRNDTSPTMLASGDPDGHVYFWDLEKGRLAFDVGCHKGLIHTCHFLQGQPVVMTSGTDNSIKVI